MRSVYSIGLGEHAVARTPGVTIKAYSLGSCVALCLLHPIKRVYGMAHVVMPDSIAMPSRAKKLPCYFVDTALPYLLHEMMPHLNPEHAGGMGVVAKLAGGASVLTASGSFDIGKRSLDALTLLLKQYKIRVVASDIRGSIARTVVLNSDNGDVMVSSPGQKEKLL